MAAGDKYVMNGVWLTCDKGVSPVRFKVTPKPVKLYDEDFANEADKVSMVNIMPFGVCSVTHSACVPAPVEWQQVMDTGLTVLGARPLLDVSKCQCSVGGKVSIHMTLADAQAAVRDQILDEADQAVDAVQSASNWAFWGGVALAVGGAVLVATGVGAPLGAALVVGGEGLMTASSIAGTAATIAKGATSFFRDPSLQNGLSVVGEVAENVAIDYVMNKLGEKAVPKLGEMAQKAINRLGLSEKAISLAERILCTLTGHPVDVISGYVFTEATDFELPGPIPLKWERLWNSTSIYQGPLGHGWHHAYDMAICLEREHQKVAFRADDGRGIAFNLVPIGQIDYNRMEKLSFVHDEKGYAIRNHARNLLYRFNKYLGEDVYQLSSIENPNGFSIKFSYDSQGHLTQMEDSAHRILSISNDHYGRITAIATSHPSAPRQIVQLVQYQYNRAGELVACLDALAQKATYHYQNGLLVKETFKNGLSFYFRYEGSGENARCVRTWGDGGIYDHKLAYFPEERKTVVTDSLGWPATYFGNENGLVVQHLDRRGGVQLSEYNEFNELLTETNSLGYTTTHNYDERGNYTTNALPDGATILLQYNAQDQLVAATDAVGGQWQWRYDEQGNLLERTDPMGLNIRYAYQKGLLVALTDAANHTATLAYDQSYNLIQVKTFNGLTNAWLFDSWGRCLKATDPKGNVQWRSYDLLGRVLQINEPDGNVRKLIYDGFDNVIRAKDRLHDVYFAYQGMGKLVKRTEAGLSISFVYDTEEQLREIINEHRLAYRFQLDTEGDVITESGFDGLTRRYRRDVGGRVAEVLLPTGLRNHYQYDRINRVTGITYGDGSKESYQYRKDGALLQATNADVKVSFERDLAGRILKEQQGNYVIENEYDGLGQRIGLRSSLGAQVDYRRDALGEIEQITTAGWQSRFERDDFGLEVQRTMSGGVRTHWQRDAFGRPAQQQIVAGRNLRNRSYTWQYNDRLTQITDSLQGTATFEHDQWGNLSQATYSDGGIDYRLPDAVGNLFRSKDRKDRKYGLAGQLLEANGTVYHYNPEGFLSKKITKAREEWTYEWNAQGMLAKVIRPDGEQVSFEYDALGRRISKRYKGKVTRWVWDGNKPLHEWSELEVDNDNVDDVITWLFEEDSFAPIAKLEKEKQYSIVTDHLGTPIEMYQSNGLKTWEAQLDTYGRVRKPKEGDLTDCPFRFQGQYEDEETKLYYNRFRYYTPEEGLYISQDPIGLDGGTALYSYVNDPNSWVDVLGLACGPAVRKNSRGRWTDERGRFAVKPPRPNYTSVSAHHESGVPGTTRGYHAHGSPNPLNPGGHPQPKSKFGAGEGGAGFSNEVYDHPDVTTTVQSHGRRTYDVADMGRQTGINQAGNPVRGGQVVTEGNPPLPYPGNPNNPNDVVTQFPR